MQLTQREIKNICIIMTFVASNIAKSINLLRQVLVHTIPTARHPKYQSKYFKCRKIWFSHCSMRTHARRQQHSNYNNSWLQEKLYISIEYELSVFTFSNDCFVYSKHLPSFIHQNRLLFPVPTQMQWYSCNDSTKIFTFCLISVWFLILFLISTQQYTMATNKCYTIRIKCESMQPQLKAILFSLKFP